MSMKVRYVHHFHDNDEIVTTLKGPMDHHSAKLDPVAGSFEGRATTPKVLNDFILALA